MKLPQFPQKAQMKVLQTGILHDYMHYIDLRFPENSLSFCYK